MRALVWSACVLGLGLCGHVSIIQGANKPLHRTLQQQATGGVVRQGVFIWCCGLMNGSLRDTRPQVDVEAGAAGALQNGGGKGAKGSKGQGNKGASPVNQHYGTVVSLLQEEALEVQLRANPSLEGMNSSACASVENLPLLAPRGSSPNAANGTTPKGKKWFASWFTPSFVVIALVVLNGDMARGALFPTLWPLVFSLGGDRIMQGYVVSAFSLGRLVSSPFIGRLSEVYGYRRVLIGCSLLLLLGTLLYASATSLWHVLASQITMGLGSGTLGVTRAYVAEQTAKKRRTVLLAYLTAVQYAGFTVTPLIGGVLSDIFADIGSVRLVGPLRADRYTSPALFMSLMSLGCILLLATVFEDHVKLHESAKPRPLPTPSRPAELIQSPLPRSPRRWFQWSRQDLVIFGAILLNVATKGSIAIYETLGIEFARSHFSLSAPDAGFTFAFFGCLGVMSLVYMKRLVSIWNDVQLIWGGMVLMALCNMVLLGGESFPIWRFYVAIFLMYAVGYPVGHTAVIGMFSKVLGRGPQGYLMGWFGSAGSLARVIFPILGGHVAEELGYNWLFGGDAVLLVVGVVLLLVCQADVLHLSEGDH